MTDFLDSPSQIMSTAPEGDEEQQVKAQALEEAAALSQTQKEERGRQLQQEVQECLRQLAQIEEKLRGLEVRQLFGPEGDTLKDQADEWVRKLATLKIRQSVFPPQA